MAHTESQIFIIMLDDEYRYLLYRIEKPDGSVDEETPLMYLNKPILGMDRSNFHDFMSFTSIGSRIFMIGGAPDFPSSDDHPSNNVYIFDTESYSLVRGPPLRCGKYYPYLFTFGSQLFALSNIFNSRFGAYDYLEGGVRFEVLDTDNIDRMWSALPIPDYPSDMRVEVSAVAGVYPIGSTGGVIFISVTDVGTYAYEVDTHTWKFASTQVLPFSVQGVLIPQYPSMCNAGSLTSKEFCVYQFFYGGENSLKVKQCEIGESFIHSPLSPPLECVRRLPTLFSPHRLEAYILISGVDEAETSTSPPGNRYVQIYGLQFVDRKSKRGRGRSSLEKCSNKEKEFTAENLKLNELWKGSYFGGKAWDSSRHVAAAFAI